MMRKEGRGLFWKRLVCSLLNLSLLLKGTSMGMGMVMGMVHPMVVVLQVVVVRTVFGERESRPKRNM